MRGRARRVRGARQCLGQARLELRDVVAELSVPKPGGGQRKETERMHERVDSAIPEPEARGPLLVEANG